MEAIGEARVEWMSSSDIQASDEEVFNYTTVLPIKGNPPKLLSFATPTLNPASSNITPQHYVPSTPNLQPCLLNPSLSTPTSQPQPLNPNLNLIIVLLFAIILPFTKKQAILLHGASIYKL